MKTIAEKFEHYLKTVYPTTHHTLPTAQKLQLKMAFYGGFIECFTVCRDSAKCDNMDEAVASLQALVDESLAFADEINALSEKIRAQASSN